MRKTETRTLECLGQRWRKSKPGALAQDGEYRPGRASSPARPGQGCGVSWLAPTQHNGLFGKVAAVTALKLRLVRLPLRAQPLRPSGLPNPRYVLRPHFVLALRVRHGALAPSHTPGSHWPARYRLRRNRRGFWPGAARGPWSWPPPTLWGQALARLWPAPGGGPSAPQGGSLHPRRWGAVALASAEPVAA